MKKKYQLRGVVAHKRRFIPSDSSRPHGHYRVTELQGTVEVTLDLETILYWVSKVALRNKTGRTVQLNGMIKARVTEQAVVKVTEEDSKWNTLWTNK